MTQDVNVVESAKSSIETRDRLRAKAVSSIWLGIAANLLVWVRPYVLPDLGIAGMALFILGIVLSALALLRGTGSLVGMRKLGSGCVGKGCAVAGIIAGLVGMAPLIVVFLAPLVNRLWAA